MVCKISGYAGCAGFVNDTGGMEYAATVFLCELWKAVGIACYSNPAVRECSGLNSSSKVPFYNKRFQLLL